MNYYISYGDEKHLPEIGRSVSTKRTCWWAVNPKVAKGDRVIVYLRSPVSALVAMGTVLDDHPVSGAKHGWPGHQMAHVQFEKMFHPPVPIAAVQEALPDWGWPRAPRTQAHIPDEYVGQLLHLLHIRVKPADLPDEEAINARISADGGFSDVDTNRRVDHAAMAYAREAFEQKGWTIEDRQRDFCGYDLLARKANAQLHLEVKGAQGSADGFILTANELRCAETDDNFRLCVVTHALERDRSMQIYTAKQMRQAYSLSPIAYIGRRHSHARAHQ
jgi:hypothetical protein